MESDRPLEFSYNTVAQEITCAPDAISGLREWLDRVGAGAAMVVCGPSILQGSDAVYRVQEALGHRCVGLFSGVSPTRRWRCCRKPWRWHGAWASTPW